MTGKTTAMLHHALMIGRPFIYLTENKNRPAFFEKFERKLLKVKNITVRCESIEDVIIKTKQWIKKGYTDIYIDDIYLLSTQRDTKNKDFINDILKMHNDIRVHITVQTYNTWMIPVSTDVVKNETVSSNQNIVEIKIITREEGFIKVSGDFDCYNIDLNQIYD